MKNKSITTKTIVKGKTTRRLISGTVFAELLEKRGVIVNPQSPLSQNYLIALDKGISKEELDHLVDLSAKKMFAGNALWRFANKYFHKDITSRLFGVWTTKAITANLVPTRGKKIVADQLNGVSATPVTGMAIGTGAVAAAAGDTALGAEITTNGGGKGAATATNQTTTTAGDTARWVKTYTFTGSLAITEEGLFDSNTASTGNMLARQVFSAVNVVNTDTLQITHNVQFT